ncbi:uncharacterized protein K460DRAFT_284625 [Cucurbitaria berberidis CBS 394.84]|uniref:BTB domain-containing protein n=1 Tax=Cucurbitaria berberidis CBS 394.84 TaxID=1168544 RepID=A0A9P4GII4_9PLEO|nr:uncharacterized protein K460DRAFT_284625 [Cucurbitaria berberidis CBS 394.84]KAF1845755.1 hypothetical protein K460DRAFT_284625 [Cucurbitaria berberidis CBS 394.84]
MKPVTPPAIPKVDPRTARNLLRKAFRFSAGSLPSQNQIRTDHEKYLLETPIGRDFALVTALGIEFKIHSMMLIGGPKMLQEGLYPGGAPNLSPPTLVNLPPHFHPMLVDRIVCFLYRGSYSIDNFSTTAPLPHATHAPDSSSPEAYRIPNLPNHMFHLHMYALAEELEYDALLSAAHAKLYQLVTYRFTPQHLKELVDATFAPLGSATRICKDEQGYLQQLVAVATLTQEANHWTDAAKEEFVDLMQLEEYASFWEMCKILKEQNQDLLASVPKPKGPSKEKVRKPRHGVQKKAAAKTDKKSAALTKALKTLTTDGGKDMDMEVD